MAAGYADVPRRVGTPRNREALRPTRRRACYLRRLASPCDPSRDHGQSSSDPPTNASVMILFALGVALGVVIVLWFLEFGRDLEAEMEDAGL